MARYGKKAQDKVEKTMHEHKHGTLRSGGSGKKVTSRKRSPDRVVGSQLEAFQCGVDLV